MVNSNTERRAYGILTAVAFTGILCQLYIGNAAVVVPSYRCANDPKALDILQQCFTDRKVVGVDTSDIMWGLGVSLPEPAGTGDSINK